MTRHAFSLRFLAISLLAFLAGSMALESRAADLTNTNLSAWEAAASRGPVLTNAQQVHWLTPQQATNRLPVRIQGVVTCALPGFGAAVVQDDMAGIYIDHWNSSLGAPPQVGEWVQVKGVTDPDYQFAPRVQAIQIFRLGTTNLPAPVRPYWDQLINGSLDTEFVEIETTRTANNTAALIHLRSESKFQRIFLASLPRYFSSSLSVSSAAPL